MPSNSRTGPPAPAPRKPPRRSPPPAPNATQAREEAGRFRAAAVNAQLDAAINAGTAQRGGSGRSFRGAVCERDFDAAVRELGERRLALNTHALALRPTGAGVDLSTAHGRSLAFNARIDALDAARRGWRARGCGSMPRSRRCAPTRRMPHYCAPWREGRRQKAGNFHQHKRSTVPTPCTQSIDQHATIRYQPQTNIDLES